MDSVSLSPWITQQYNFPSTMKDNTMTDEIQYQTFKRKPFYIQAVRITEENIEALAALIGEVKTAEDGECYIALNKKVVPNMRKARLGWWVTHMNDKIRCYSPEVFSDQFDLETPSFDKYTHLRGK